MVNDNLKEDPNYVCKKVDYFEKINKVNKLLSELGESPIKKRKLDKTSFSIKEKQSDFSTKTLASEKYLADLKESFFNKNTRAEKLHFLTTIPSDWGIKKIRKIFGISKKLARQAKKLQKKGFASYAKPKIGRRLPDAVVEKVKSFYLSDDISRMMPGAKDYKSVVNDNKKRYHEQKRLLLHNLAEIHKQFIVSNPEIKISISKFSKLRPAQCILANQNGTHNVCVCKTHENVKLKVQGLKQKLKQKKIDYDFSYHDLLKDIVCKKPRPECYLLKCKNCPENSATLDKITGFLIDNNITEIDYTNWTSTDR